jgi:hypothetical protein
MKRTIRILTMAVLVAVILVASVSPAMARRISGGILLPRPENCTAIIDHAQDTPAGERLRLNPSNHPILGCWVELPPAAHN